MKVFHLIVHLFGIRNIKDTQCGFKLLSRAACQKIIPRMHVERWIFDIEMLVLAELLEIPVIEIPVTWHEVDGTKMSLVSDSIQMLFQLILIRINYWLGIWKAK
jgi:dolichyl-phosphate beta-glucosyltransferase